MKLRIVNAVLVVMTMVILGSEGGTIGNAAEMPPVNEHLVARDFFERTLLGLMSRRRMFLDGFANATELLQRKYDAVKGTSVEARGRRKRLKQMNRTLIAVVMAYTLKFMFLIPTFIGTLILFKFTAALAGFFYALFAAVLGLERHPHEHS